MTPEQIFIFDLRYLFAVRDDYHSSQNEEAESQFKKTYDGFIEKYSPKSKEEFSDAFDLPEPSIESQISSEHVMDVIPYFIKGCKGKC